MRIAWLLTLTFIIGWVAPPAMGDNENPKVTAKVLKLLKAYAGADEAGKSEVIEKLLDIGPGVLDEISRAILHKTKAISDAAEAVYSEIAVRGKEHVAAVRKLGQAALAAGQYEEMRLQYRRLAVAAGGAPEDIVWLGHAYQLAGRWPEAAKAYAAALAAMDAERARLEGGARNGATRERMAVLDRRRPRLILFLGRVQRGMLGDAKAASATFARAAERPGTLRMTTEELLAKLALAKEDRPKRPDDMYVAELMLEELAMALEKAGQFNRAIAARSRLALARRLWRGDGRMGDVNAIGRLIRKLGPKETPATTIVAVIPAAGSREFVLAVPAQGVAEFQEWPESNSRVWRYAVSAPPGKEFATLEFACDLEQSKRGVSGQFSYTLPGGALGGIRWPKNEKFGRKVITVSRKVAPGGGLAYFKAGEMGGRFKVHSVKVTATFRPAGKPRVRPVQTWVTCEGLPAGGRFTRNGKTVRPRSSSTVAPGRYVFTYEVPGRTEKFKCEIDLAAGRRYSVFVNLDSPFKSTLTPLGGVGGPWPSRDLARLPDGRWLAAWSTGKKIMLATANKDLTKWDKPRPLPLNEIFDNMYPSLLVDAKGVVHMAYFSDRLAVENTSTGRFKLWLTRSTDGVKWSRPRPVSGGNYGSGWPVGGVDMVRGPKGKYWLFWRDYAGSAESVNGIRAISKIVQPRPSGMHVWDPNVVVDAKGKFHMVFDDFDRAVCYSSSTDGSNWTAPVIMADNSRDPRLLVSKGRFALISGGRNGVYLQRGALDKPWVAEDTIKIASGSLSMAGSQLALTPDGEVLALAGNDTFWLLRAKLGDLVGAADNK